MIELDRKTEAADLRIVEYLLHVVDRTTRHIAGAQAIEPLLAWCGGEDALQRGLVVPVVLDPQLTRRKTGIISQVRPPDRFGQSLPEFRRRGEMDDEGLAVAGDEGCRQVRAFVLARRLAGLEISRGGRLDERRHRLQQRRLHFLAQAGLHPRVERRKNSMACEDSGQMVGEADAWASGAFMSVIMPSSPPIATPSVS